MIALLTLTVAAIVALWTVAVYEITQPGAPFHVVRRVLDKVGLKNGEARTLYYPVLYCNECMTSLHSLILWPIFGLPIYLLPIQIIITYGIVRFIRNQWYG